MNPKKVMKNIRNTKLYKEMDNYTATGLAEGFIEADNEKEVLVAWQKLHDTGLAYSLQGWFGRTATELINRGVILK